ncbi:hypothetical protein D918_04525 [Trichuris suis]|nr:hypothetical protein D918_04525 [Trichuris suis]
MVDFFPANCSVGCKRKPKHCFLRLRCTNRLFGLEISSSPSGPILVVHYVPTCSTSSSKGVQYFRILYLTFVQRKMTFQPPTAPSASVAFNLYGSMRLTLNTTP